MKTKDIFELKVLKLTQTLVYLFTVSTAREKWASPIGVGEWGVSRISAGPSVFYFLRKQTEIR